METWLQDFRYGFRMLRKNRSFTLAAVLTLALGIGANTAIFSVIHAVLIRPLPYASPEQLAIVWTQYKNGGQGRVVASGPEWAELRQRSHLLQDVAGTWVSSGALTGTGEPEQIRVAFVTSNFLALLGVAPQLGRTFVSGEQGTGSPRVIVLSDGLWKRSFGANPGIVGQGIRLDGATLTVVGVMPAGFRVIFPGDASVPADVQAWVPFPDDLPRQPRDLGYLRMIARLRPGTTFSQAQSELGGIARQLRAAFSEYSSQGLDLDIEPLHQDVVRDVRPTLLALFAGVGMVLLIACANVGNLLLVRARSREKETTMRLALGATAGRVVRQFLVESLLLACLGGIAGLPLAWAGVKLLLGLRPGDLPQLASVHVNLTAIAFAFAISLLTGLLCALAPITACFQTNLLDALKDAGRGSTSAHQGPQRILVFTEVALGFVLLVASGLMIRTFVKLLSASPGFQAEHVLTFQVAPSKVRYPNDQDLKRFFRELQANLLHLAGVQAVGAISHLPLDDYANWYEYYWPEGATAKEQTTVMADHRAILPGYFATLGVPLVAGRDFNEFDDSSRPNAIIIDETLAQRTWPGQDPLGKRLNVVFVHNFAWDRTWAQVVGVAKHVRYENLTTEVRGQVYVPYYQSAREKLAFTLRTSDDPAATMELVRQAIARLDKDVPLYKVQPMEAYVTQARAASRFTALLSALLAGLALLLASIGIYGVMSYWVVQRTNEIGIRMALGGQSADITRLVVGQAVRLALAGLTSGFLVALPVTRLLAHMLYGIGTTDPLTFLCALGVLALVALIAGYVPARRATKVDPMVALRCE